MTFRQVLAVIWQRKILVIATLLLVLLIAGAYMHLQTKVYSSTVTLKMSLALTRATEDGSGAYANIAIETDPELVNNDVVLKYLPADTPAEVKDGVASSVTGALTVGTQSNRVAFTGMGDRPDLAQDRANAAAKAYTAWVNAQLTAGTDAIKSQYDESSKQLQQLQRQLNNGDDSVASEVNNLSLSVAASASQLQQINAAGTPVNVLKPSALGVLTSASPLTVIGVGFLSGLIAGMGAALIRDQFDDRLLSAEDAEDAIGEPVLGELAVDKGRKKNDLSVPTERRTNTAFNEGIRTLRTSLQVLAPQRHSMIVVTSPEPGEGKTFVTASLAVSLARAGRQVIIVSGDLRRPRLTRYFGVRDTPGLGDAITTEADLETLRGMLQPASQPGLMVLPHGSRAADPADLLATQAVGPVLSRLRQLADIVIIDSPPALALADAANLATHADGVLVISALHRTKRHTLTGTLRNLRANGVNVFGVVCNRSTDAVPKSYEATYLLDESNSLAAPSDVHDRIDRLDDEALGMPLTSEDDTEVDGNPAEDRQIQRSTVADPTSRPGSSSHGSNGFGADRPPSAAPTNGHTNGSRRSTDPDEFGVRR